MLPKLIADSFSPHTTDIQLQFTTKFLSGFDIDLTHFRVEQA